MNDKSLFFRYNTIFGMLIGLTFALTSFIYFKTGKSIAVNPQLSNVIMLLSIVGAFLGGKRYRDEQLEGVISYSKALATCTYLISVAALTFGIYTYLMYRLNPELLTDYRTIFETALKQFYAGTGKSEEFLNTLTEASMTPVVIAFSEIFGKILLGFVFSLLIAGILKRNEIQKVDDELD